jgi:hypothetical protein
MDKELDWQAREGVRCWRWCINLDIITECELRHRCIYNVGGPLHRYRYLRVWIFGEEGNR